MPAATTPSAWAIVTAEKYFFFRRKTGLKRLICWLIYSVRVSWRSAAPAR